MWRNIEGKLIMNKKNINDIKRLLLSHDLIEEDGLEKGFDATIEHLSDNSQDVVSNSLFVCKGSHFKKEYLTDAILKGAICYITQDKTLIDEKNYILVKDIRRTMALLANYFYDFSWKQLILIAVTGTKGKSTTAYMIKSILDTQLEGRGGKCGILSSIENYDGIHTTESHLTTKEPLDLHKTFYNMVKNGCIYCVMEVSSQALKYDRVWGIEFDMGVFLNIGEDHISDIEHTSFEDYYESKLKLLPMCKKMLVSDELDIAYADQISFGLKKTSYYRIKDIQYMESKNQFVIENVGRFDIEMPGDFNILNATAAIGVALELGINGEVIRTGILKAHASGRMEIFRSEDRTKTVIVDYAHNKLSYEALFASILKEYADYKIITIFGCPGNKAFKRRAELPSIAENFSDYIFITEEDHGEEALEKINKEIYAHIQNKSKAEIEGNRALAVKKALQKFDEKTVILLLGKGRETRQKRGTEYVTIESDVEIVKKYL